MRAMLHRLVRVALACLQVREPVVCCTAALVLLLAATAAAADGWRIDPGLVADGGTARLAERYPEIRSAADLEALLRDIGRRQQLLRLEAHYEDGVWVISGKHAALIKDIDIDMVTRLLKQPVYAAVQGYIGQVDSPETRAKVSSVIQKYMQRRGYPQSKISLTTENDDGNIAYNLAVNEGEPCIIRKIELGFRLPSGTKLDLNSGDLCDMEEIEAAISTLEATLRDRGYNQVRLELADVAYQTAGDTATVFISGVLGQKVRYEIVDNTHRFLIDDLFADEELTKVDPTIVGPDAMAAELARRYRNRGFLDVVVKNPEVKKAGEDEFVYVFYVDPGKQYILKSVQFEGVTVFKQPELLDIMGLESLWQTSRPFNYEELQQSLNALKGRYQQAGYWDAKVRDPGTGQRDKETGTVRLTIQVEEGLQRILHTVSVTGNAALSSGEIEEMLGLPLGQPLDRAKLVDFQQAIRAAYLARGYLYADVTIDLKPAADQKKQIQVDLQVTINEGARVRIGDVTVIGLVRTEEKVVRRELLFQSGEWYDPDKISQSRQALSRLGIFRSVQIVPADRNSLSNKEREIDLTVDVREGRPGNVSFGPGWSLAKGWNYDAEASYNNIGGVGRQASIRGSISEEKDQYAIGPRTLLGRKIGTGYTEPWIFDLPIDASIRAKQEAEWGGELWELSYGGEIELKHKLREILPESSISVFYGQKIAKTEGSSLKVDELVASDVRIGSTGIRFNLDKRDNLKFPTTGYTLDTEFAWARYDLGGDLRYFRWDVGTSRYFGFTDDWVLAFNVDLTSYDGIQRRGDRLGILPPQERLASGGDTVRGFKAGSLGPQVRAPHFDGNCNVSYDNSELDGTSRTTIKTEIRHKVSETFAVTGFVDNGNVFFSNDQMRKFQKSYEDPVTDANCPNVAGKRSVEDNFGYDYADLLKNPGYLWTRHYYSYGTSLNLLTALGSVNFTYGLPWREPESEACKENDDYCIPRAKQSGPWWRRGEFLVNVGARF